MLEDVMAKPVLWYYEWHSVPACNQFKEFLGISTTQFGFGTPDYQTQSEEDGAFRNDERQADSFSPALVKLSQGSLETIHIYSNKKCDVKVSKTTGCSLKRTAHSGTMNSKQDRYSPCAPLVPVLSFEALLLCKSSP